MALCVNLSTGLFSRVVNYQGRDYTLERAVHTMGRPLRQEPSAKAKAAIAAIIAGARSAARAYVEQNVATAHDASSLVAHQVIGEEEDFVYDQVASSVTEAANSQAEAQAKAKMESVQQELKVAAGGHSGAATKTPAARKRTREEVISPEAATAAAASGREASAALAAATSEMALGPEGGSSRRVRSRSNDRA